MNGAIVIAAVAGLTSEDVAQNCCAEMKLGKITITMAVFPGDTLWATSEILETADVPDRPDAGLVTYAVTARNQREQVVCSFERTVLVKRAAHWLERDAQFEQNKFCSGLNPEGG